MTLKIRRWTRAPRLLVALLPLVAAFHARSTFFRSRIPNSSLWASLESIGNGQWLKHGLLLSSFTDGLKPNPEAVDFLMRGLVAALWRERQASAEAKVTESSIQSPCCGPDLDAVMSMEQADAALADLEGGRLPWRDILASLAGSADGEDSSLELRFLYIPTAMYAIRRDSQNTPGKQRQRARADGKKRRNEIVDLLSSQLGDRVTILAATLDLDDGSIKQPEGSNNPSLFPKVGVVLSAICRNNLY